MTFQKLVAKLKSIGSGDGGRYPGFYETLLANNVNSSVWPYRPKNKPTVELELEDDNLNDGVLAALDSMHGDFYSNTKHWLAESFENTVRQISESLLREGKAWFVDNQSRSTDGNHHPEFRGVFVEDKTKESAEWISYLDPSGSTKVLERSRFIVFNWPSSVMNETDRKGMLRILRSASFSEHPTFFADELSTMSLTTPYNQANHRRLINQSVRKATRSLGWHQDDYSSDRTDYYRVFSDLIFREKMAVLRISIVDQISLQLTKYFGRKIKIIVSGLPNPIDIRQQRVSADTSELNLSELLRSSTE